jgi:hypothetical protein
MDDYDEMEFMRDTMIFMEMRDFGKSFDECSKDVREYMNNNRKEIYKDLQKTN